VHNDRKLAALQRARTYPDSPERILRVETHYAWVFLSRRFAYKLKKPVRTPYLDYSTTEARYQDAHDEIRLNRRLAAGVYLDVVPLSKIANDEFRLEQRGSVVDWLVKMRRLPTERMLDHALKKGAVNRSDIEPVVELWAKFVRDQEAERMSGAAYCRQLVRIIVDNLGALRQAGVYSSVIRDTGRQLSRYVDLSSALFQQRVAEGRVKELHGDLRPEHVCLTTPPVVIDCLQFSRQLRVLDALDELAFLALECGRLQAEWVEPVFLRHYRAISNDDTPPQLIAFYKGCRALLRARLAAARLWDCEPTERSNWLKRAEEYVALASQHAGMATSAPRPKKP